MVLGRAGGKRVGLTSPLRPSSLSPPPSSLTKLSAPSSRFEGPMGSSEGAEVLEKVSAWHAVPWCSVEEQTLQIIVGEPARFTQLWETVLGSSAGSSNSARVSVKSLVGMAEGWWVQGAGPP